MPPGNQREVTRQFEIRVGGLLHAHTKRPLSIVEIEIVTLRLRPEVLRGNWVIIKRGEGGTPTHLEVI